MVYRMDWEVDGGCRGNGQPGSIGAAAAVLRKRGGGHNCWTRRLPSNPRPTNQRAEITAIILALEQSLEKYDRLNNNPYVSVKIYSDSRYAIDCMNVGIYRWSNNGWTTSAGNTIANKDLIMEASDLDDRLKREGDVEYIWIPREQNTLADEYCNDELDDMADQSSDDGYY